MSYTAGQLDPCPFCGGEAEIRKLGGPTSTYGWAQCKICKADIPAYPTHEAVADAWNKRSAPTEGSTNAN